VSAPEDEGLRRRANKETEMSYLMNVDAVSLMAKQVSKERHAEAQIGLAPERRSARLLEHEQVGRRLSSVATARRVLASVAARLPAIGQHDLV
jgi:hypothetical protein